MRSDEELVEKIKQKRAKKETILENLRKMAIDDDDDIVAGDTMLALFDPYTRCKIALPVKGKSCKHPQCFDALTFIQMTKTAKKIECPICYKKMDLNELIVDEFFDDILKNTSEDVEHVQMADTGEWKIHKEQNLANESKNNIVTNDAISSEAIIILSDDDDVVPLSTTMPLVPKGETVSSLFQFPGIFSPADLDCSTEPIVID